MSERIYICHHCGCIPSADVKFSRWGDAYHTISTSHGWASHLVGSYQPLPSSYREAAGWIIGESTIQSNKESPHGTP